MTVSALIKDPAGTPTAGTTAFVLMGAAPGTVYAVLVKNVGDYVYNNDTLPLGFKILSKDTTAHTVTLQNPANTSLTATLSYQGTDSAILGSFQGADTAGATTAPTAPTVVSGATGAAEIHIGQNGSNGRDGALLVPPRSGGDGAAAGSV